MLQQGQDGSRQWVILTAAGIAGMGLATILFLRPIAGLVRRIPAPGKLKKLQGLLSEALERLSARRGVVLACVALSILIQGSFALLNAGLCAAIGGPSSAALWLFAWPLAKLLATLPISIGGLGVREAGLSGLVVGLGAPAAPVIAASMTWQTILIAGGLLGAVAPLLRIGGAPRKGAT